MQHAAIGIFAFAKEGCDFALVCYVVGRFVSKVNKIMAKHIFKSVF